MKVRNRVLLSLRTGDILTQIAERRVNGGPVGYTACFGVVGTPPLATFEADELESLSEAVAVAIGVIDTYEGTSRLPALIQRWGRRIESAEQEGGAS